MGRLPAEDRKYNLQELQAIHREILRRVLLGEKNPDIARDLDVTPAMVCYAKNSALSKEHLSQLEDRADDEVVKVRRIIGRIAPSALAILESIVEDPEALASTPIGIKVKVAQDLLDRAGLKAPTRIEGDLRANLNVKADKDWVDSLLAMALSTPRVEPSFAEPSFAGPGQENDIGTSER